MTLEPITLFQQAETALHEAVTEVVEQARHMGGSFVIF